MVAVGCETAHPGYVANPSAAEAQDTSLQDGSYLRDALAAPTEAEQERADRNRKILYGVLIGAGVLAGVALLALALAWAAPMNYN
jgi:hypothetical protein